MFSSRRRIDEKRTDLRVADPGLLEKCIHALQLLGRLTEAGGFDFVFKGGTSMVILMPAPKRLSIDIDKGGVADNRTGLIQDGIRRMGSHLIGDPYRIDEARVSAAKAACLAALLKQSRTDQAPAQLRFDPDRIAELRTAGLHRWPVLNRLKAISPEAFHYWHILENLGR
ncbi:nucleotidyl transferase AbiEii/AbiGii toxin family protein [Verrucomicrobiota bacterium]